MRACELLEPEYLVHMLKAVKHLSMSPTLLEVLQNANAIDILVKILDEQSSGPYSTVRSFTTSTQILRLMMETRKCAITSSRPAITFAALISRGRRKQHRPESYPA